MRRLRLHSTFGPLATAVALLAPAAAQAPAQAAQTSTTHTSTTHTSTTRAASDSLKVIASGLNEPKKITIAANGDLVVALSGDGKAPKSCTTGNQRSCVDTSGGIDAVTPYGTVIPLLKGLVSISSGSDLQATGPVEAEVVDGHLQVLYQGVTINAKTGHEIFGSAGRLLEDLVSYSTTGAVSAVEAELGPFEAKYNPDKGAGTDVKYGDDVAIDSDPYGFVPYRGGYAIADAGANDVLFLSRTGKLSVLAVLPTIRERAAAKTYSKTQTKAIDAQAQSVPTAVAVGPDGALYVGELGGIPFDVGKSSIYRIVPGHRATVYATGFTSIGDIAFDAKGRLLVLELDRKGLSDPGLNTGHPASGELIRLAPGSGGPASARTVLATTGLDFPTGMAVAANGDIYIANDGTTPADKGQGGEIVRLSPG